MIRLNPHYAKLKASYLFSDIARRVAVVEKAHPGTRVIRLGIGDVTEPLPGACLEAFHRAVDEMGDRSTFRGYGPEQGYPFLREAIVRGVYQPRGAEVGADEIFVSDGSKCDTGNFQELFATDIRVAIPDPVYPVYVDTNVMAGRTGPSVEGVYPGLTYLPCTEANGYVPDLPSSAVDLVYLCFPNNPTGAVATRPQLEAWVRYARESGAILLYDAAYADFICDPAIPRSIYEIPGAQEVAVEFRSFSKSAGFTGVRCAWTVVPRSLQVLDGDGTRVDLHGLWSRRHTTKFNGVSYPVQRAAEAVFTEAGQGQCADLIQLYLGNARRIRSTLTELGFPCVGGDNAPYIWIRTGGRSWDFFDRLLNETAVVCTPGAGFGNCGEGHVRLSAFNSPSNVEEALDRIRRKLSSHGGLASS